jgi:hypothetical protein
MSDQGPWVTKTILELEERVAELTEEIEHLQDSLIRDMNGNPVGHWGLEYPKEEDDS